MAVLIVRKNAPKAIVQSTAAMLCGAFFIGAGPGAAPPPPAKPVLQHMQLQVQYAGPLQDTIIQRWRDPADGLVCYIYLPIAVHHSAPGPSGYVEYGEDGIGSISCVAPSDR